MAHTRDYEAAQKQITKYKTIIIRCISAEKVVKMAFIKLVEDRYSLRKFSEKPVEKKKLELILKAGRLAPTACNNQPQRILVIQSPEAIEKLKKCTPCHFGAPMALIICYDSTLSWKRPHDGHDSGDVDASIICTHMMLQAAEQGLGTTWVGYFDPAAVKTEFSLADNIIPVAILPLGYAAEGAEPAEIHYQRKPIEETVSYL